MIRGFGHAFYFPNEPQHVKNRKEPEAAYVCVYVSLSLHIDDDYDESNYSFLVLLLEPVKKKKEKNDEIEWNIE